MADCLFCRIIRREIPAQIVHEDDRALVFKDVSPQAPAHLLIVPKKHLASLSASTDEDEALLGHLQRTACRVAETTNVGAFRLVTNNGRGAGQSVEHLHYHLLGGRPMTWPPG
jgi:histidine triad (HIT) family protein